MPIPCYNVFARKDEPAIRCAVVQERPVPTFIQKEGWEFQGTVKPSDPAPAGFRHGRAADGTRIIGFYLFFSEPA